MQFVFGAAVFAAGVVVGVTITNGTFDRVLNQAVENQEK
jgi:hypothetical protein